jgi:hypothetical protein
MKFLNDYNLLVQYSSIIPFSTNSNSNIKLLKEKLVTKLEFIYNNPVESRDKLRKDLLNKSGVYM